MQLPNYYYNTLFQLIKAQKMLESLQESKNLPRRLSPTLLMKVMLISKYLIPCFSILYFLMLKYYFGEKLPYNNNVMET